MQKYIFIKSIFISTLIFGVLFSIGCQPTTTTNSNVNSVNQNVNLSNKFNGNTNVNSTNANSSVSTSIVETKEPENYQANVTLKLEAGSEQQKTALPTIAANVARNGLERRMEFNLPNGEKVIYLDKAGTNFLLLPNRKQFAELNKDSLGFEVRQLLTPGEIVQQVKNLRGVERVGEENINGREVVKYRYGAVTNTGTQAGQVATESYFLIDKQTGLPLHSETVSQSQDGNVQGYKSLRLITEMSDIKIETTPELFVVPPGFAKIDAAQVKAQVELIFNAVALLLNQALKSSQSNVNSNSNTATPTVSPTPSK